MLFCICLYVCALNNIKYFIMFTNCVVHFIYPMCLHCKHVLYHTNIIIKNSLSILVTHTILAAALLFYGICSVLAIIGVKKLRHFVT